jgi:YbgC/YbaW family acyl-CoA thioester hydrolase
MIFDKKELSAATSSVFDLKFIVRFQHVDAAGVVFFARFFEYVHEAYEGFLSQLGLPLSTVLREQKWIAPLKHVEADYFRALRLGEEVTVQLVAAEVQGGVCSSRPNRKARKSLLLSNRPMPL